MGDVLAGKYRVERVLGRGGMGVVVAATHLHLDQRVAIKFLLPDALSHADVVSRFAREAKAASKVTSEHVAKVIDVGTLDSGAPYMVMEYLEGHDLAAEVEAKGRLPVEEAVTHVLQALEALAEAHKAGIVHRDLKPANLFLANRPDKTSIIKVLDFGISKLPQAGGAVTHTAAIMGSPLYMSPEQLVSSKSVDARSDVWSIGVVLYELLSGAPPYRADSMPEIVALILQAPLAPLREARPDVPEALAAVVARCLEKQPVARYANVAELARALAPFTPDGRRSFERIARVLDLDTKAVVAPGSVTLPLASSTPLPTGSATENPAWTAPSTGRRPPAWLAYVGVAVVLGAVAIGWKVHSAAAPVSSAASDSPPPTATQPSAATTPTAPLPALDAPSSEVKALAPTTAPSAAVVAHPLATSHATVSAHPTASTTPLASAASAPPVDTTPAPASSKRPFILK